MRKLKHLCVSVALVAALSAAARAEGNYPFPRTEEPPPTQTVTTTCPNPEDPEGAPVPCTSDESGGSAWTVIEETAQDIITSFLSLL